MNKKIIRRKDVVFIENQLFDDGDNVEKLKTSVYISWSLGSVLLLVVHDDHGGDEQEDCCENVSNDTPIVDDVELTEQAHTPPVEIPLRSSTRER